MNQGGGNAFYADQGSQSTILNVENATWNLSSNNGTTMAYQDSSSTMNWVNEGSLEKSNTTGIVYYGTTSGTSNFTNDGTLSVLGEPSNSTTTGPGIIMEIFRLLRVARPSWPEEPIPLPAVPPCLRPVYLRSTQPQPSRWRMILHLNPFPSRIGTFTAEGTVTVAALAIRDLVTYLDQEYVFS